MSSMEIAAITLVLSMREGKDDNGNSVELKEL